MYRFAAGAAGGRECSSLERYYELRAAEYDATSYELLRADVETAPLLAELEGLVSSLTSGRMLDVGCGTGWLTRLLRGQVVGLDASESMVRAARARVPGAVFVLATAPPLPFLERSFDLVLTSHLYGHLPVELGAALVRESLRVGDELLVVEQAWPAGGVPDAWEERTLADGSVHRVYKRYLTPAALAAEVGGEVVFENEAFVAVRARAR